MILAPATGFAPTQPTDCTLMAALDRARKFGGFALCDLKRLRYARTTWYGRDELALRREIDTYLDAAMRNLTTNGVNK